MLWAEFCFLFGWKATDWESPELPRVSHPFPACQIGGVTPSELAGGVGWPLPGQGQVTEAPSPSVISCAHLTGQSLESN